MMAEGFCIGDRLPIGAEAHDRCKQFLKDQGQILRPGRRRWRGRHLCHGSSPYVSSMTNNSTSGSGRGVVGHTGNVRTATMTQVSASPPTSSRPENLALIFQELFTAIVRLRANRQAVSDAESFRHHIRWGFISPAICRIRTWSCWSYWKRKDCYHDTSVCLATDVFPAGESGPDLSGTVYSDRAPPRQSAGGLRCRILPPSYT